MAEGRTASYDPVTGERREMVFQYEPTPPPDRSGMNAISPEAVARAYQSMKVEEADKAVSAAIQFQGLRAYQKALQSGEASEKALAKYGPMMFYSKPQAFGPSVKAMTPPPVKPQPNYQYNPAADGKPAYFGGGSTRPVFPPQGPKQPAPMVRSDGRGGLHLIDPTTATAKTIIPPRPTVDAVAKADTSMAAAAYKAATEELQEVGDRKEGWFGNVKKYDAAATKRDEARAKLQGGSTLSEQAARTAPPMPRNKAELKRGERYLTPRGEATWDGDKFVQ